MFAGEFDPMESAESVRSRVRRAMNIQGTVRLVWESAPQWTLASLAFVFVQGLLPLLGLWLMKLVVDGVATTVTTHDKQAGFGRVATLDCSDRRLGFGLQPLPHPRRAGQRDPSAGGHRPCLGYSSCQVRRGSFGLL